MTIGNIDAQDALKVASTAFAVFSVIKTVRDARNDHDGLQLTEALMRGTTLALSIALIIRNLNDREADAIEAAEGTPA